MSSADSRDAPGFHEPSQPPIGDIPTDPEEFLRWGTTLDPDHPFKYELSNGEVSRTMIKVSRAHWRVTANILGELFWKPDRTRYQAGPTEFGVRTGVGVRYPDVIVDRVSSSLENLACEAPAFRTRRRDSRIFGVPSGKNGVAHLRAAAKCVLPSRQRVLGLFYEPTPPEGTAGR